MTAACGVPLGKDYLSPNHHSAFFTPQEMMRFIDLAVAHQARLLSKDKAVTSMAKRLLLLGVVACRAM